jgi:hypothetical protein
MKPNILSKLHPGEPYFVIRAQDKFAPAAIQSYATLTGNQKSCHEIIEKVLSWQKSHPDKVKTPD